MIELLKKSGLVLLDLLLYLITFSGITFVFIAAINLLSGGKSTIAERNLSNPFMMIISEYLPQLVAALIAMYITHVLVFKRDKTQLGFTKENAFSQFSVGYLLSFTFLLVGFIFLYSVGWIKIDQVDTRYKLFFGFALFFLIQSGLEEVISRAYMIPAIESRFGKWAGVIVTSLLFSLMHFFNPSISILALLNIFAAGLLMGLLFIRYRSIWAPLGLHAGWNFLQGSFFGFEVSGHDFYSLLDTHEIGPDIWTGGSFGFEGSILSLAILSICSYLIFKTIRKEDQIIAENTTTFP